MPNGLPQIQSATYGDVEKLAPIRQKQGAGDDIAQMVNQVGGRPPGSATQGAAATAPAAAPAGFQLPPEVEKVWRAEREAKQRRNWWIGLAMQPDATQDEVNYALAAIEEHKALVQQAYSITPNANLSRT